MVETNENILKNEIEMSTTTVEQEGESTKVKTSKNDNILHSVSIDNEKKELPTKRLIQIIGKKEDFNKQKDNDNDNDTLINNDELIVIHEFDASTEDPFTLEAFDTLIQQHAEKNKDFIIARVTTVDPSDELKTYHSYYSGHHINKVLFRTQPDQSLLHRMKAKNPLNNMNIIGDVHYYVVKAANVRKLPTFVKSSSMSITSKKTLKVKDDDVAIVATSSLKIEEKDFTTIKIDDTRLGSNGLRSAPPSICNFDPQNEGDDEKVVIEMEYLSNNNNNKRWSADDSLKPLPKAFTVDHSAFDGENLEKLLTSFKLKTFNNNNNDDNNNNNNNNNNNDNNNNNNNDDYSQSNKFIDDNDGTNSSSSLKDQLLTITQSPTEESFSIPNEEDEGGDGSICYKAVFYATDDDFLMRSIIRQFFKSNALDPMDAQLFTINPLNNSSHAINGIPPSAQLERIVGNGSYLIDPMIVGQAQSHENSREEESAPTSRWRRIYSNMKSNKGLRWLVLMYMIFGFLLIRFVISETYAYLMAFLLMLCLFLVFCIGSGIGLWGR